jgi:hypothetical protein
MVMQKIPAYLTIILMGIPKRNTNGCRLLCSNESRSQGLGLSYGTLDCLY